MSKLIVECCICKAEYVSAQAGFCPYCTIEHLQAQLTEARAEVERYKAGVALEAVVIHAPHTIGKAVSVMVADNSKVGQRVRVLIMEDGL